MSGTSYLLSVDGSEESRSASYLVWELAKQTEARVVAQHVIDTAAVWRFLSYDRAGFIGSGLYMEAREKITSALYSIAEALMLSYTSQIDGQSLEFETYIDEGDPATEIARRAKNHDMVIITHRRRDSIADGYRMFERLAETCSCPVMVVGNAAKRWTKMRIFVNAKLSSPDNIYCLYQLATMLGLPVEVYFDSSVSSSDADRFDLGGWSPALGVRSIERSSFDETIASAPGDILLVVSADLLSGTDAPGFRTRLRSFLDQSSDENGLLLWTQKPASQRKLRLAS